MGDRHCGAGESQLPDRRAQSSKGALKALILSGKIVRDKAVGNVLQSVPSIAFVFAL